MSGMYPQDMSALMQTYLESELPEAVFAAAVKNNLGKNLGGLVGHIVEEQMAMDTKMQRLTPRKSNRLIDLKKNQAQRTPNINKAVPTSRFQKFLSVICS